MLNRTEKTQTASRLFGGALFAAGIAASAMTAEDASAQCDPQVVQTIDSDSYEFGPPWGNFGNRHG